MSSDNFSGPVHWRDPYNGDTERIAADAKAWNEKMYPCLASDNDPDSMDDPAFD